MTELTFGSRLRELRQAHNLTQQSLGDALHYAKSSICRLENGHRMVTVEDARRLDRRLGADGELEKLAVKEWLRREHRPRASATQPRCELPPAPTILVGRRREVISIADHLLAARRTGRGRSRSVRTCLIHGLAGVGKTAVATYAANELQEHFPDGQLFLDLYGHAVDRPPMRDIDVLGSLLRRFLPQPAALPTIVDDLLVELRTVAARGQYLLLLENATNARQVELLLSALPGSSVIVTSRSRLTALDDACRIELHELSAADAERLFRLSAGRAAIASRIDSGESGVTTEDLIRRIVTNCYLLPLPIKIVASRFRDNEALTLTGLDAALSDQRTRFAEMSDGERSMAGLLSSSLTLLKEPQRSALMALSAHPGVRLDRYSSGALLEVGPEEADKALDGLTRACMLAYHSPGAYQMPGLIRDFARHGPIKTSSGSAGRSVPLGRLFDYYLRSAVIADRLIEPDRYRLRVTLMSDPPAERSFTSIEDAVRWMDAERENLLEVCPDMHRVGFHEMCWRFCYYLRGYLYTAKLWSLGIDVFRTGLRAAEASGNYRAQGIMLSNLGLVLTEAGDPTGGVPCYLRAIAAYEAGQDHHGTATARAHLGWARHLLGEDQEAYDLTSFALWYFRASGSRWNVASTAESLGLIESQRGWSNEAIGHLAESREIFRRIDRPIDAARVDEALLRIADSAEDICEVAAQLGPSFGASGPGRDLDRGA